MRRIMIDNLTLLVGGTRLEREQQMDKFQNASDFMTAIIQNIREDDNGGFLTRLRTVPCFALSEVQSIGGKPETESLFAWMILWKLQLWINQKIQPKERLKYGRRFLLPGLVMPN